MKRTTIFRIISGVSLFAMCATLSPAVIAQTSTQTERMQERQQLRQENVQERQTMRQEQAGEIKESVQERRQQIRTHVAEVHANRLQKRFGFYSRRLNMLIDKLETRFIKMSEAGMDVSGAQSKLEEARTAVAEADSLSQQAISGFGAIDDENYEGQREQALAARDIAMTAREKYKEAVTLMREAVQIAKEIRDNYSIEDEQLEE